VISYQQPLVFAPLCGCGYHEAAQRLMGEDVCFFHSRLQASSHDASVFPDATKPSQVRGSGPACHFSQVVSLHSNYFWYVP